FLHGVTSLGITYGEVGNNLPPPEKVLGLLDSLKIQSSNSNRICFIANSNVQLIVTVENQMLAILMDPQQAYQWVNTHITPYFPSTNINGEHPHQAVMISQYLHFLSSTKAPFWIDAYPYFAYKDDPSGSSLDCALFNPNAGMVDPYTKLRYENMLYAQVGGAIFDIARMGYCNIEVKVSKTGCPSKGDPNEVGATLENAAMYNRNFLRRKLGSEGTPLRPSVR
ncbi:LOW QUALITY PROTEIN: Glyco_hydro_17 domain-containing protein, partial [Cephalotus follicularis]